MSQAPHPHPHAHHPLPHPHPHSHPLLSASMSRFATGVENGAQGPSAATGGGAGAGAGAGGGAGAPLALTAISGTTAHAQQLQLQQQHLQQQHMQLHNFWQEVAKDIQELDTEKEFCRDDKPKRKDNPSRAKEELDDPRLPLARIKKIMKIEDEIKADLGQHRFMISAEAPLVFQKACEIFIKEVTLRAWTHTEENKRRTLQKTDISMAVSKADQFDFLIDIVPREESKPAHSANPPKREEVNRMQVMDPSQLYLMQSQMMGMPISLQDPPHQLHHTHTHPLAHSQTQQPQSHQTPNSSLAHPHTQSHLSMVQHQQLSHPHPLWNQHHNQQHQQVQGMQGLQVPGGMYYQPAGGPMPGHGTDFQQQGYDPGMMMGMNARTHAGPGVLAGQSENRTSQNIMGQGHNQGPSQHSLGHGHSQGPNQGGQSMHASHVHSDTQGQQHQQHQHQHGLPQHQLQHQRQSQPQQQQQQHQHMGAGMGPGALAPARPISRHAHSGAGSGTPM